MIFSTFTSTLPSWWLFLLIVGSIVGCTCLGLLLQRRNKKRFEDEDEGKVVQSALTYLGSMYGVLLALMILNAQTKYTAADMTVTNEAAAIMAAARDSTALPQPLRGEVQGQLRLYTSLVLSDDWPVISAGHQDNQKPMKASIQLNTLWVRYGAQIARAPLGSSLMSSLNTISTQRAQRFALSRRGLPDSLWLLLGVGTFAILYLATSLRIKDFKQHVLMVLCISTPMSIFLWLVADLDNPFGGTLQVSSSAFVHALQVLNALPH